MDCLLEHKLCSPLASSPPIPRSRPLQGFERGKATLLARAPQPQRRPLLSRSAAADGDGTSPQNKSFSEMKAELARAVAREDYKEAAKWRDMLQQEESSAEQGILEANSRFYAAFEQQNIAVMREVWGTGDHVQCTHPGALCVATREHVLESWRLVLLGGSKLNVNLQDVRVHGGGEWGMVTCVEQIEAENSKGKTVATNIFEKQGGDWKLIHHHGSPSLNLF